VTAPADPSTAITVPMPPIVQIVGVNIAPSVYTYFPNVNATVNIVATVKVLIPLNATISYPISVNGRETKVMFPITISLISGEGDVKTLQWDY